MRRKKRNHKSSPTVAKVATSLFASSDTGGRCDGGDLGVLGGHGLGLPDVGGVDLEDMSEILKYIEAYSDSDLR